MIIEREWAMPNKNTFSIKPIRELLAEEVDRDLLWIDPFANESKIARITNDLNPRFNTDYHLDALDFFKQFDDESVDGVLYDPPYSPSQVKECYEGFGREVTAKDVQGDFYSNHKREVWRILKKGGKVITFGWNSNGMGIQKEGIWYLMEKILLVAHGGNHNDTIVTVNRKVNGDLTKGCK